MVLTRAFALRAAGRRVGHPGVPRGADARSRRRRSARRPRRARRRGRRRSSRTSRGVRAMGEAARDARGRAATPGRRSRRGSRRSTQRRRGIGVRASARAACAGPARAGARVGGVAARARRSVLALVVSGGAARTGAACATRSTSSSGAGSSSRFSSTSSRRSFRALCLEADDRPGASASRSRASHVFSAFGVGLLGNAVLPAQAGELARVAVLRRRLPDAPEGTSATLVGTVFAHRLFDLCRRSRPRPLRPADGEDSALGDHRASGSPRSWASRSSRSRWLGAAARPARPSCARHRERSGARRRWRGRGSASCRRRFAAAAAIVCPVPRLADAALRRVPACRRSVSALRSRPPGSCWCS